MKKILILVAQGTEDGELIVPSDLWHRAGYQVDKVSIYETKEIELAHKNKIICDKTLSEVSFESYDAFFLPGGPGRYNFTKESIASFLNFAKANIKNPKYLYLGICGASEIYNKLGLITDQKVAGYPGTLEGIKNQSSANVCHDQNFISAKALGQAVEFALKVIEVLSGKELKDKVAKQIQY